jgi:hypothetical protein
MLVAAFECFADPVLIGNSEHLLAPPDPENGLRDIVQHSDRRLTEVDLMATPPPAIDEIRFDNPPPGRKPGLDEAAASRLGATPGSPVNFGTAFGESDTLRDFGNPSVNPAGAPATGLERARRGGAPESGSGGSIPLNPAQAMLRDAVDNALKLVRDSIIDENEMVNFSIVGVEFNLALGGGRRSLTVNGSDMWPTMSYDPLNEEVRQGPSAVTSAAMQGMAGQSAGGIGGSAQPWASAQSSPVPSEIPLIAAKVREFVTEPMTIIVAFGCLFLWMAYEIASAVRERRRRRRYRRRHARARTRR